MMVILAWRNIWRNLLRTGIMIAAMVFGLLGVMLMAGFMYGMVDSMIENSIKYQTAHFQVHHPDFLINEDLSAWIPGSLDLADALQQQPGVAAVTVRHVVDGMIASAASSRGVRINGIQPEHESNVTFVASAMVEGSYLDGNARHPIVISTRLAEKLNARLGSKVVLTFSDARGDVSGAAFRVNGLFKTPNSVFDESNVYVNRDELAGFTGLDAFHEIAIRLTDRNLLDEVRPALSSVMNSRVVLRDWVESQPVIATMMSTMDFSNMIMIGVFIIALGLGIINIMLMSVFERTREFGVLMAVGMTRSQLMRLIVMESLLLGSAGGFLGLFLSAVAVGALGEIGLPFGKLAEGLGAFGMDTVIYTRCPIHMYAITMGMVVFISLVAALYPTHQILKKQPYQAMSERH